MRCIVLINLLFLLLTTSAAASDGVVNVASNHSVSETADRLERVLQEKGMTVFNRIKHSEGAAGVGVKLNPTELVIFGNPKVGAPLMQCQQKVAIDLPQKALVWQDDAGQVWISYNDPSYLQRRHSIEGCELVLAKIEKALAGLTATAAAQ